MRQCDILIIGSGYFAEIMANDLAATAPSPVAVAIAGRNAERVKWLETAGNARSAIYGSRTRFTGLCVELGASEDVAGLLDRLAPSVVVHAASLQSPWSVDSAGSEWSRLVNEAGFGITIAFHATLPLRTAQAIAASGTGAAMVNTCYPDGVNPLLKAAGMPIACGVGNIAIFSSVIAGTLPFEERGQLRVLAHHNHLVDWRRPGAERSGVPVRAWIGEQEMSGVQDRFRGIRLPFRDLNVVSGASAVPVLLALAGGGELRTHVPGPAGLPGGYPVRISGGRIALDLPAAISQEEAVAWNGQFTDADGVAVGADGWVRYSPRARQALGRYSKDLAEGFPVSELDAARDALNELRSRLGG